MASIRVRVENGALVPLDDISKLEDGHEFLLVKASHHTPEEEAVITDQLEQSQRARTHSDIDWSHYFSEEELELLERWKQSNPDASS